MQTLPNAVVFVAPVAIIVFILANVLKTWLEGIVPPSNPNHDAVFQLLPFLLGGAGNVLNYLATNTHWTMPGAQGALLAGLVGGGVAMAAYHSDPRPARTPKVDPTVGSFGIAAGAIPVHAHLLGPDGQSTQGG